MLAHEDLALYVGGMNPPSQAMASSHDMGLDDLLPVPQELATNYERVRTQVVARVDAALFRRPDLGVLLGDASSSAVRELHRYLAAFLASVFTLGLPEMLLKGLPRVLAGYRSRGLPQDYFELLPEFWGQAIQDQLGPRASPLVKVCAWLSEHPKQWIPDAVAPESSSTPEEADRLVNALLMGDSPGARSVIRKVMNNGTSVEDVFVDLVQPALYEIGDRWEKGEITAAQEHLASALVARILASVEDVLPEGDARLAVVTTSPTETHEFGAWMVADVLRSAGWTVRFLGSQLPLDEILHYVRTVKPGVLCLSVTLEIHLPSLKELIAALRADPQLESVPVLVGGQAFGAGDRVWQSAGADAVAHSAKEVVEVAEALLGPAIHLDGAN